MINIAILNLVPYIALLVYILIMNKRSDPHTLKCKKGMKTMNALMWSCYEMYWNLNLWLDDHSPYKKYQCPIELITYANFRLVINSINGAELCQILIFTKYNFMWPRPRGHGHNTLYRKSAVGRCIRMPSFLWLESP